MDTKQLLLDFSSLTGVSGREGEAANYGASLLAPYGKISRTPLGSVVCRVREPCPGQPHILLDAHIDEIGMVVTYIEESGFLRVAACGGIDRRLLLAAPVFIHGQAGPVQGVVCSVPPHLAGENDKKNKKVDEIYIDIGFDSKEESAKQVAPGDVVTICSESRALLGGHVSGKAIDDRAGCVSLLKALEYLGDFPLACGLSVLFSSMEETGGAGAKTAAYELAPTHAVAVDVSFGHTPDAPKEKCGQLHEGPMIGIAPILSRTLTQKLTELAKAEGIPYQVEVMGGKTSTNADHIAVARGGVQTALLSIPQKYMHTPIETVAVCDVENTARLLCAFVKFISQSEGVRK